jgi:hypothetical protein
MDKKIVSVEIEDLRTIVGGGSELTVAEKGSKEEGNKSPWPGGGTVMCYRFAPSPDQGDTWTKVRGSSK